MPIKLLLNGDHMKFQFVLFLLLISNFSVQAQEYPVNEEAENSDYIPEAVPERDIASLEQQAAPDYVEEQETGLDFSAEE
jgi:hypothetical protein